MAFANLRSVRLRYELAGREDEVAQALDSLEADGLVARRGSMEGNGAYRARSGDS